MLAFSRMAARVLRLGFIPAVLVAFIPYAIAAGHEPGLVLHREDVPYPVGRVIGVIALLAVESSLLFAMLAPASSKLSDWRRPLKALGVVFIAFLFEPMITDMPGYVYVNQVFLFTWFVILALLVIAGIATSRLWSSKATDSEHAA